MSQILTPALTVSERLLIRKIRELPVPGTLLKRRGDKVLAQDIVGEALLPGDLEIVRVAERLGIESFEAMEGLKVKVGQTVAVGDLLCEHSGLWGLFSSSLKSQSAGEVELITERTGHIGIRAAPRKIQIESYISGTVVDEVAGKSLTIESEALLVQGIFGVGGERLGKICMLSIGNEETVTERDIPLDSKGAVLVGGAKPTIGALKAACEVGATGFICGSIDDQVLKDYVGYDIGVAVTGDEAISMSLMVTEGFGNLAISSRIIKLLSPYEGRGASINGATQVRAGAVRPELIICHADSKKGENKHLSAVGLDVGTRVRLIRYPYFGMFAEIVELPQEPQCIDTGASTRVLKAKLGDGKVVTVPRANVEVI